MSESTPGPGISYPPPLVYVVGFVAARFLDYFVPLASFPEGVWWPRVIVGVVLLLIGVILCWWAVGFFRKHETKLMPNARANDLVITGPYRFSRNPMYVALFFQFIGVALLVDSIWCFVMLPAIWAFLRFAVIMREERYLEKEFGESYTKYLTEVRRWI